MKAQLLTDEVQAQFDKVDLLAQKHQAALEFAAASERMSYLHDRIRMLHRILVELRIAADLLSVLAPASGKGKKLWQQTYTTLKAQAPSELLSPGSAIVAGGLDLLRLVDYTGASVALTSERRDHVISMIAEHLATRPHGVAMAGSECSGNALIERIRQAITRIADAAGELHPAHVAQEFGWIDETEVQRTGVAALDSASINDS